MADGSDFPRVLSEREAAILAHLLAVDDPRMLPLRAQSLAVQVVGGSDDGCATIDLAVDRSAATPASLCSPAVDSRSIGDPTDPDSFFELILFLDDGWLSSLEIVHYGAVVPAELPPPSNFEPPYLRC